jgi:hypothetical protein
MEMIERKGLGDENAKVSLMSIYLSHRNTQDLVEVNAYLNPEALIRIESAVRKTSACQILNLEKNGRRIAQCTLSLLERTVTVCRESKDKNGTFVISSDENIGGVVRSNEQVHFMSDGSLHETSKFIRIRCPLLAIGCLLLAPKRTPRAPLASSVSSVLLRPASGIPTPSKENTERVLQRILGTSSVKTGAEL